MFELKVEKREKTGTRSLDSLRKEGFIPAVVYGKKEPATPIKLSLTDFKKTFSQAGESSVISLKGLGEEKEVLIYDVDVEPVRGEPRHVDFYAFEKGKKLKIDVPLEFIGVSPAVKDLGGILVKVMHEIEIEALPKDLPQKIEVDITPLVDFEVQIHVRDLKLPSGVTTLMHETEVVAMVSEAKEEVFEEPVAPDLESIEVEAKGKAPEEGAEGGAPAALAAEPKAKEEKKDKK